MLKQILPPVRVYLLIYATAKVFNFVTIITYFDRYKIFCETPIQSALILLTTDNDLFL